VDAIYLGHAWNPETGREAGPVTCDLNGHFLLLAPTGSGKGVGLEIPNLLIGLRTVSVLSIDPSGQNAAVCAAARREMGQQVLCLNPFRLHVGRYPDLQSAGCNPLVGIHTRGRLFYQQCAAIGEALIKLEGKDPHWPESARGLITGMIMWEVLKAEREGRAPLLENVRTMLCEPEETGGDGRLKAGLRFHAAAMIASRHWQIADLAGRFIKEESREIDSIASTARTQTEWLLSVPMRADLRKNGINWSQLMDRLTTIFVIIPAEFLESQEGTVWLRLIIMAALRAFYERAGRRRNVDKTVFMLSEFAQLGHLKAVEAARGQARKYGVRLWPVLQDVHQLAALYGPRGPESFAGQCRAMFSFAPGDWESAEWMSRRSGEHDVRMPSASEGEDGRVSVNYSIHRERVWKPEDILGLPPYHGLVWFHGRARPVPVYAEPYVDEHGRVRPQYLRAGARPDPYHVADDENDPQLGDADAMLEAYAAAKGRREEITYTAPPVLPDLTTPSRRKGFWAEMRESFLRGRDGRPWRDRDSRQTK
jgi:type IV secretion system protein VirD4